MTAICNGGASQGKPGLGTEVIVPTSLISAGLALISPWLIPVAAVLEGFTFDLVSSCSTDPPALPVFTLADAAAVPGGVFNPGWDALVAKVLQLVRYYFWYQYCQCAAPTVTPAPVSTVLPPSGVSVVQRGSATPCASLSWQGPVPSVNNPIGGQQQLDLGAALLPVGGPPAFVQSPTNNIQIYPVPNGQGPFHLEIQGFCPAETVPCDNPLKTVLYLYSASQTLISRFPFIHRSQPNATFTDSYDIPPTAAYWGVLVSGDTGFCGPIVGNAVINVQTYCAGSAPGAAASCCPADPSLVNLTQQIYQLELAILRGLPTSANSYADATVHAGLTGAGSFTLHDRAIALRAEVTGGLPVDRFFPGNPTYYFDVGHVTPLAEGSPYLGSRLVYQKQLYTLPLLTDSIGYTFSNGVTVKITELVKGP